jgi:hypothetical protein
MKKLLLAAALATSAMAVAVPAHAEHDTAPGPSDNHWGSAGPVLCAAETTVAPALEDLVSASTRTCTA